MRLRVADAVVTCSGQYEVKRVRGYGVILVGEESSVKGKPKSIYEELTLAAGMDVDVGFERGRGQTCGRDLVESSRARTGSGPSQYGGRGACAWAWR